MTRWRSTSKGLPTSVCFDHDLGEMGENERNGFTCAKLIVDYCIDHDSDIPQFNIQSSNPVGGDNIESIMNGWHKFYEKNVKRNDRMNNVSRGMVVG